MPWDAQRACGRRSSAASPPSPSTRRCATCCPCGCWRTCAPARPSPGTSAGSPPPTRPPRRCSTRWCTTTRPTRTTCWPPSPGARSRRPAPASAAAPRRAARGAGRALHRRGHPARILLDRRGCGRVEGGGTSLRVACELARPECLFLLLGHGASPGLRDGGGLTPLQLLLRHLGLDSGATPATGAPAVPREAPAAAGEARQRRLLLLDLLVLYTPAAARLARCELLGEDKFQWLAGLAPPSLLVRAMQVLVTAISPCRFPEALDELPLPPFLQPLDLTGKG